MQHVSTYNSHLQAMLRTVIALQGGCVHLGSHVAYSVFAEVFIFNVTYIYCAVVSRVKCVACAKTTYVRCSSAVVAVYWSGVGAEKETQPPHKQKAETHRSTSGREKPPSPPQRRATKAEKQRAQTVLPTPRT